MPMTTVKMTHTFSPNLPRGMRGKAAYWEKVANMGRAELLSR